MKLSLEQYEQLKQNYLTVKQFVIANKEVHERNKADLKRIESSNAGIAKMGALLLRTIQYYEEMERILKTLDDMGIDKVVEK